MGVIYKIISPTFKVYVGKTYDLRKRINAHKCVSKKDRNIILHNSIKKYGWDAHKLEVIEEIDDSLLNEREIFWINQLKTYCYENEMGMNMTKGGDGQRSTWMHKIELRKWFSERFTGEGNPFYGKDHSDEFKKAQSKRAKEWNIKNNHTIPKWGAEKGRLKVIRAILCYDKYGNFLKEYDSLSIAEKELKINHSSIVESCKGLITGVSGKYVFKYKEPNYPLKIEVGEIKEQTVKRIVLYLDKNFNIIKEYPSAFEASQDLKLTKTTINNAALKYNGKPLRTGHIFMYKDLYEQKFQLNNAASQ